MPAAATWIPCPKAAIENLPPKGRCFCRCPGLPPGTPPGPLPPPNLLAKLFNAATSFSLLATIFAAEEAIALPAPPPPPPIEPPAPPNDGRLALAAAAPPLIPNGFEPNDVGEPPKPLEACAIGLP